MRKITKRMWGRRRRSGSVPIKPARQFLDEPAVFTKALGTDDKTWSIYFSGDQSKVSAIITAGSTRILAQMIWSSTSATMRVIEPSAAPINGLINQPARIGRKGSLIAQPPRPDAQPEMIDGVSNFGSRTHHRCPHHRR